MAKNEPYNGDDDAEKILERIMLRSRWTAPLRDKLARALEKIVQREISKRKGW